MAGLIACVGGLYRLFLLVVGTGWTGGGVSAIGWTVWDGKLFVIFLLHFLAWRGCAVRRQTAITRVGNFILCFLLSISLWFYCNPLQPHTASGPRGFGFAAKEGVTVAKT